MDRIMRAVQIDKPAGVVQGQSAPHRSNPVLRGIVLVEAWIERHRQRRALRELSDHVLKDTGVSRSDAEREGSKPFWTR
jgi:uncharacterized protein YjiS (DUF1127 family)